MSYERTRLLATIGGMALVIFFVVLISLLNEGRVIIGGRDILLTLFVGVAAYLGWPKPKPEQPGDDTGNDTGAIAPTSTADHGPDPDRGQR